MIIERLTLQGFKSFARRSELHFETGVSGIIGPNGSGKSNIVEAIRFVMGSRARVLRASDANALIFHGGKARSQNPFAEVELVIRDGNKRLVVRRRIDRKGQQIVTLNGKRATFRQIETLLAGSGLGKSANAVIGQGEVSQIIESGPQALLERLEEAAGLRVVNLSLRETEQRLVRARKHLERISEKHALKEQERNRLRAEADQAEQSRKLQKELQSVQRGLYHARKKTLEKDIADTRRLLAALKRERAELERASAAEEQSKEALLASLSQLQEQLLEAQAAYTTLENKKSYLLKEKESIDNSSAKIESEIASLQREVKELGKYLPPKPPLPPRVASQSELKEKLDKANKRLQYLRSRKKEMMNSLSEARYRWLSYKEARYRYQIDYEAYRQAAKEKRELEEKEKELRRAVEELQKTFNDVERSYLALREEAEREHALIRELEAAIRAAESEEARLRKLIESGADLGRGPRTLAQSNNRGMLGVVANLLSVPKGLEIAAEAALGPRLQWVLVDDEAALEKALDILKRRGGRATILARSLARPRIRELDSWLGEKGVVGAARELFSIPHEEKLSNALFGDTLIVEDISHAIELAKRPRRVRMVTLQGEVIEVLGSVSGGRARKDAGERLLLRNRLSELQKEKEKAIERLREIKARADVSSKRIKEIKLEEARDELSRAKNELRATRLALERLVTVKEPHEPEEVSEPDETPLEEIEKQLKASEKEKESLDKALSLWEEYRRAKDKYQLEKQLYEERQARIGANEARLSELRREKAVLADKKDAILPQLKTIDKQLADSRHDELKENVHKLNSELEKLNIAQKERVKRLSAIASALEAAAIKLARREATLEEVSREGAGIADGEYARGSVRKLQARLREIQREIETIGPVNYRAEQSLNELQSGLSEIEEALREASAAAAKLETEAGELRRERDERLKVKFNLFREKFSYFGRALLSGIAKAELSEEGLHISIQPLGKRNKDLRQLSTGEKTMGALAFLFSLAEVSEGSLPIAVLDEVDAPLDESNILRFTSFLRKYSDNRQFILVTHQKRSMEACDVIWGVTNRDGESMIYGIKKKEEDLAQ